jgi:hypothetical protein
MDHAVKARGISTKNVIRFLDTALPSVEVLSLLARVRKDVLPVFGFVVIGIVKHRGTSADIACRIVCTIIETCASPFASRANFRNRVGSVHREPL